MNQRQLDILSLIIKEYIQTGTPVASELLVEKYDLGISPATIRNEMAALEKDSYVFQPHISAGRVPSDKAYRFYIDYLVKVQDLNKREEERLKKEILEWQENSERFIHNLARTVAEISNTLVVSGILNTKDFYEEAGVSNLLDQYPFEDLEDVQQVLVDLEYIDRNIWKLTRLLNDETKVYIGEENPLPPIRRYSTIISRYPLPDDQQGFLVLVGPKRMNYEKNISLVDYVINSLS